MRIRPNGRDRISRRTAVLARSSRSSWHTTVSGRTSSVSSSVHSIRITLPVDAFIALRAMPAIGQGPLEFSRSIARRYQFTDGAPFAIVLHHLKFATRLRRAPLVLVHHHVSIQREVIERTRSTRLPAGNLRERPGNAPQPTALVFARSVTATNGVSLRSPLSLSDNLSTRESHIGSVLSYAQSPPVFHSYFRPPTIFENLPEIERTRSTRLPVGNFRDRPGTGAQPTALVFARSGTATSRVSLRSPRSLSDVLSTRESHIGSVLSYAQSPPVFHSYLRPPTIFENLPDGALLLRISSHEFTVSNVAFGMRTGPRLSVLRRRASNLPGSQFLPSNIGNLLRHLPALALRPPAAVTTVVRQGVPDSLGGDPDVYVSKVSWLAKPRMLVQPPSLIGSPRREGAEEYGVWVGLQRKSLATQVSQDEGVIAHRQRVLAITRAILDQRYQAVPLIAHSSLSGWKIAKDLVSGAARWSAGLNSWSARSPDLVEADSYARPFAIL